MLATGFSELGGTGVAKTNWDRSATNRRIMAVSTLAGFILALIWSVCQLSFAVAFLGDVTVVHVWSQISVYGTFIIVFLLSMLVGLFCCVISNGRIRRKALFFGKRDR